MGVCEIALAILMYSGLTILLVRGEIFEPFKKLVVKLVPSRFASVEKALLALMYCSQCLGFWVGLAGTVFMYFDGRNVPVEVLFLFPASVSTFSILIDRLIYGRNE